MNLYTKTIVRKLEAAINEGGDIECSAETAALIYSAIEILRGKIPVKKPEPILINRHPYSMCTGEQYIPPEFLKQGFTPMDSDIGDMDATSQIPTGSHQLYELGEYATILPHTTRVLS